jgi:IclR family transcriptional regulator, pca regulon regulatory protein
MLSERAMSSQTIIQVRPSPAADSPFRTRWGRELSVHEGNPDFVLSLARGLRVIEVLQAQPDGLSIAEISRHTALSRAAVRRLLITLGLLGYIEADARKYRLQRRVTRAEA